MATITINEMGRNYTQVTVGKKYEILTDKVYKVKIINDLGNEWWCLGIFDRGEVVINGIEDGEQVVRDGLDGSSSTGRPKTENKKHRNKRSKRVQLPLGTQSVDE